MGGPGSGRRPGSGKGKEFVPKWKKAADKRHRKSKIETITAPLKSGEFVPKWKKDSISRRLKSLK